MNESVTDDGRRQSILKQRSRFPLQEVPLFYGEEDTVTLTRGRRVSFGRNLVKEYLVGSAASTTAVHEYEKSEESISDPSDCSGPLDLALSKTTNPLTNDDFSQVITPPDSFTDNKEKQPALRIQRFTEGCITIAKSVFESSETELAAIIIGAKTPGTEDERRSASMSFTNFDVSHIIDDGTSKLKQTEFVSLRQEEIFNRDAPIRFDKSRFDFLDRSINNQLLPPAPQKFPNDAGRISTSVTRHFPPSDDLEENEENIPPRHFRPSTIITEDTMEYTAANGLKYRMVENDDDDSTTGIGNNFARINKSYLPDDSSHDMDTSDVDSCEFPRQLALVDVDMDVTNTNVTKDFLRDEDFTRDPLTLHDLAAFRTMETPVFLRQTDKTGVDKVGDVSVTSADYNNEEEDTECALWVDVNKGLEKVIKANQTFVVSLNDLRQDVDKVDFSTDKSNYENSLAENLRLTESLERCTLVSTKTVEPSCEQTCSQLEDYITSKRTHSDSPCPGQSLLKKSRASASPRSVTKKLNFTETQPLPLSCPSSEDIFAKRPTQFHDGIDFNDSISMANSSVTGSDSEAENVNHRPTIENDANVGNINEASCNMDQSINSSADEVNKIDYPRKRQNSELIVRQIVDSSTIGTNNIEVSCNNDMEQSLTAGSCLGNVVSACISNGHIPESQMASDKSISDCAEPLMESVTPEDRSIEVSCNSDMEQSLRSNSGHKNVMKDCESNEQISETQVTSDESISHCVEPVMESVTPEQKIIEVSCNSDMERSPRSDSCHDVMKTCGSNEQISETLVAPDESISHFVGPVMASITGEDQIIEVSCNSDMEQSPRLDSCHDVMKTCGSNEQISQTLMASDESISHCVEPVMANITVEDQIVEGSCNSDMEQSLRSNSYHENVMKDCGSNEQISKTLVASDKSISNSVEPPMESITAEDKGIEASCNSDMEQSLPSSLCHENVMENSGSDEQISETHVNSDKSISESVEGKIENEMNEDKITEASCNNAVKLSLSASLCVENPSSKCAPNGQISKSTVDSDITMTDCVGPIEREASINISNCINNVVQPLRSDLCHDNSVSDIFKSKSQCDGLTIESFVVENNIKEVSYRNCVEEKLTTNVSSEKPMSDVIQSGQISKYTADSDKTIDDTKEESTMTQISVEPSSDFVPPTVNHMSSNAVINEVVWSSDVNQSCSSLSCENPVSEPRPIRQKCVTNSVEHIIEANTIESNSSIENLGDECRPNENIPEFEVDSVQSENITNDNIIDVNMDQSSGLFHENAEIRKLRISEYNVDSDNMEHSIAENLMNNTGQISESIVQSDMSFQDGGPSAVDLMSVEGNINEGSCSNIMEQSPGSNACRESIISDYNPIGQHPEPIDIDRSISDCVPLSIEKMTIEDIVIEDNVKNQAPNVYLDCSLTEDNAKKPVVVKERIDENVHKILVEQSLEESCLWNLVEFQPYTHNPGHLSVRFPLMNCNVQLRVVFDLVGNTCKIIEISVSEEAASCYQSQSQIAVNKMGCHLLKSYILDEETKMKKSFAELPYFFDFFNAFSGRLSKLMKETLTVLEGCAGSTLIGHSISFRLYSLPFLMSCRVAVDLKDAAFSSLPKLRFSHELGHLDESAMTQILAQCWNNADPLLSFVRETRNYLIQLDKSRGVISLRLPLLF